MKAQSDLVIIRGGGDIATGVIQKFFRAHMRVLVLEAAAPSAIRRTVALCEAVYDGTAQVEDLACRCVATREEIDACHQNGIIPLVVDPGGEWISHLRPGVVVDAILAKRNLGTRMDMAPITIGLGPGFAAGQDVHAVIETKRGHDLGRVITRGSALPNTGIPGEIAGESDARVVHSPYEGTVRAMKHIGDIVHKGEPLFIVNDQFITAHISGLLRGMIRPGYPVHEGMKVADVDPRTDVDWHTISDKARCVGGGALEAYLALSRRLQQDAAP